MYRVILFNCNIAILINRHPFISCRDVSALFGIYTCVDTDTASCKRKKKGQWKDVDTIVGDNLCCHNRLFIGKLCKSKCCFKNVKEFLKNFKTLFYNILWRIKKVKHDIVER
jgi:hypothetical protein